MNWMIVIPAALLLAGMAVALACIRRHERTREQIVMRVRTTDLYGHLYPLLRQYDNDFVESVIIRPQELIIRLIEPMGKTMRYTYKKHGLDQPTQDVLYALAQAVIVDMKVLRNRKHYVFQEYTDTHRNGEKYDWYAYTIRPARKDEIIRINAQKRRDQEQP